MDMIATAKKIKGADSSIRKRSRLLKSMDFILWFWPMQTGKCSMATSRTLDLYLNPSAISFPSTEMEANKFFKFTVRWYFLTRSTVYLLGARHLIVIKKKILTLQKRALRLIFFSSKRSHAIPLFVASNILPINMLYFETVSTIMHDVSTRSTPQNIRELFIHSSDVHVTIQHAFLVCR